MREDVNRVKADWERWIPREQRIEALFPGAMEKNRAFRKEKLREMDKILARYTRQLTPEEMLTIRALQGQKAELDEGLYPNQVLRMIRDLYAHFKNRKIEAVQQVKALAHLQDIKEVLKNAGLVQVIPKLEKRLQEGQNEFSISVAYYVNETEQIAFNVQFSKDLSGKCQLVSYKATLSDEKIPGQSRSHVFYFKDDQLMHAEKAVHLLSGRSVRESSMTSEGLMERWIQFDLNDKDDLGRFRTKVFKDDKDEAIIKAIDALSIQSPTGGEVLTRLSNGERLSVEVNTENGLKVYAIEASPQYGKINIYDEKGIKISPAEALSGKAVAQTNTVKQQQAPKTTRTKTNRVKVRN